MENIGKDSKENGKDDEHDGHHLVLLLEIRHGALTDVLGNLLHLRRALVLLSHLVVEEPREEQCD